MMRIKSATSSAMTIVATTIQKRPYRPCPPAPPLVIVFILFPFHLRVDRSYNNTLLCSLFETITSFATMSHHHHHHHHHPRGVSNEFLTNVLRDESTDSIIEYFLDGLGSGSSPNPLNLTNFDPNVIVGTTTTGNNSILVWRDQITQIRAEADAA
jgi:hypothetical protein